MSRLDDLPPDQHAALSLLLRRRKSFAEVAALLSISERAVRDRAHAALAVLAPREARDLTAERREQVGDYLLGQQARTGDRLATRSYLEDSAPARAWASAVASELAALAGAALPEIPSGASVVSDRREQSAEPRPAARAAVPARSPLPSSRVGGALLLAAIVAVVIAAVILITGSGGSAHKASAGASASASSTGAKSSGASTGAKPSGASTGATSTGATSTGGRATEDRRIDLTSPDPASKSIGVAEVLSEGKTYAFYLAAEHLPPSKGFFYAVWLYNSPTSAEALTKSPPVGSNGRLAGGALLPANAGEYHTMLITRETSGKPTHPGPVVLSGAFGLH